MYSHFHCTFSFSLSERNRGKQTTIWKALKVFHWKKNLFCTSSIPLPTSWIFLALVSVYMRTLHQYKQLKKKSEEKLFVQFFLGEKEKEANCCCRCCLGWKKFGVESVRSFSTNKDNKIRSIWLDDVVFISSRNGNKKVVSGFFLFVSEGAVCFSPFPQFIFGFFPPHALTKQKWKTK